MCVEEHSKNAVQIKDISHLFHVDLSSTKELDRGML